MDIEERIAALEKRALGPFFTGNLERRLDAFEARIAALEKLVGKPGERLQAFGIAIAKQGAVNKALLKELSALTKALR